MSELFDQCESAMLGHALANHFQASTSMAIEISQSLREIKHFDSIDVMSHYLYLHHTSQYPMGEVMKLVYENLTADLRSQRSKINREHLRFSLERIHQASYFAHNELQGLSAGCNPAQRSYPLALCPWIEDEKLFQISLEEARLIHFSPQAGQVSGIINLICRRLIKDDQWNDAVKFAFYNASADLTRDIEEIQRRYEHDPVLNTQGNPAYAPNVLHTTLHCVTKGDSFADALCLASEIDQDYCPTLVGLLAGVRWGVPQSIVENSHNEQIDVLKQIGKYFSTKWKRQATTTTNGSQKNFLHRLFHE